MTTIVISGKPGCGSSTTGRLLAEKLKVKFFSLGDWNKKQIDKYSNSPPKNETERSILMWKSAKGSSSGFHIHSDEKSLEVAKKGNVVIDAKLGIRLLKGHYDASIWLTAPIKVRAERYAKRGGTPLGTALAELKEKENLERTNWKKIYGFDYFDQEKEADLVIDTGDKSPEEIVSKILRFISLNIHQGSNRTPTA